MREYPAPIRLFEKTINFGVTPAAAGDVFQVIPVLSGDVVLASWVNVDTACTTSSSIDIGYGTVANYFGNSLMVDTAGQRSQILAGTLAWNAYHIADKSELTDELEITGVRDGDHVSVSPNMDCADMSLTAEVMHPDWVAVHLYNNTGGGLDLAQQNIEIVVNKAPRAASPWVVSAGDTLDVTANEAITTGTITVSAIIIRK